MLKKWWLLGLFLLAGSAQAALNIQHWTLSNGARVYFVENHTIPILDVNVDFDAGSRRDPAGKAGTASLTNGMLARGIRAATRRARSCAGVRRSCRRRICGRASSG